MSAFPFQTRVGKYFIKSCIKENEFASSYLVEDEDGNRLYMKSFNVEKVPGRLMADGKVLEIIHCEAIESKRVVSYTDSGEVEFEGRKYQYLVTPFFQGRLLSEMLRGNTAFTQSIAIFLAMDLLSALSTMNEAGLCHNDICPQNVLVKEEKYGGLDPILIDLGHASEPVNGVPPFPMDDLHVEYMAPESLNGVFYPESDTYSVAVIFYRLLTGKLPWEVKLDGLESFAQRKKAIRSAREVGWSLPDKLHPVAQIILEEGLNENRSTRLKPLALFNLVKLTLGIPEERPEEKEEEVRKEEKKNGQFATNIPVQQNKEGKGGFADVAGMEQLKDSLSKRVIWVLKDREKAQKYRLTPPNGMLLFGPPGCGKTFFAQKFAEESGFNYMLVNGSDLGSTYVHGTQGKIAEVFKQAEENAPTVICFDEFDSFVPSRGSDSASHRADEINEFLSQLNNCSARGIFVIGTTNRMDMIDPAVLRKGRMDLHVEIPAPDAQTRRQMFSLHLKDRPQEEGIDFERLAELTEGYAASDIAFIVNEAAMVAALADALISQRHLEDSIRTNPSSLASREARRKIGFNV